MAASRGRPIGRCSRTRTGSLHARLQRDLTVENYAIGYLRTLRVAYTAAAAWKCTFCLCRRRWAGSGIARAASGTWPRRWPRRRLFPGARVPFFDDDKFTDDPPRAEATRRLAARHHRSVNAKATVPQATLKVLKDQRAAPPGGLRVGEPADPEQREEGCAARRFTREAKARHHHPRDVHPGAARETRETIAETICFAREIDPDTIQVPRRAVPRHRALRGGAAGWLEDDGPVDGRASSRALGYPFPADRDLPIARRVLLPLLLPAAQDDLARRGDAGDRRVMGRRSERDATSSASPARR